MIAPIRLNVPLGSLYLTYSLEYSRVFAALYGTASKDHPDSLRADVCAAGLAKHCRAVVSDHTLWIDSAAFVIRPEDVARVNEFLAQCEMAVAA